MSFGNHGFGCGCGARGGSHDCRGKKVNAISNGQFICNPGPFVAADPHCPPTPRPDKLVGGSITSYASGDVPMTLISAAGLRVGGVVGFGESSVSASFLGNSIILDQTLPNFAFSMPRAGRLTALSAYFSTTAGINVPGTATVRAEIYRAGPNENTFNATGVFVDIPIRQGNDPGFTNFGFTLANLPLAANDRLLLVYSATASPLDLAVVVGSASAGINIV